MQASIFAFATDLHDEGFDTVLDNVQGRASLDGVSLACAYHHARDIFPHNPVRKVRFLEGGTVFFRPNERRYGDSRIKPQVSRLAQETDTLAELLRHGERRGLAVRAWTVFLHNTTLGSLYPDCAVRNAFGDPYVTYICPANPDVRAFVRALTGDLASRGVAAILAESLSYQPFDHGYHHERSFIPLSPVDRFLLGLCFCEHCLAAIGQQGVDARRVQGYVRAELGRVLSGEPHGLPTGEVAREGIGALAGGELGRFLDARRQVVTTLVAEATEAAEREGATRFTMLDMSGAAKGYATGQPQGEPAAADAWRDGLDLAAVSRATHTLGAIGYAHDPERLRFDLAAYRTIAGPDQELSVALRPMPPDCDSAENLAAKLAVARDQGLAWVDFYHYGFMRLSALDLIREALDE